MGYDTQYSLKIKPIQDTPEYFDQEDVIAQLRQEYPNAMHSMDESGDTTEGIKWYNHEDDMKAFSKKFPELLFTLTGEGEEAGDLWKKYFNAGKIQVARAQITYDEFSPSELVR